MASIRRVAVVGSGAVGGYYGCLMARAGAEVHFLLRSDYDAVARDGWQVKTPGGDFVVRPGQFHAHRSVETIPTPDLVLVATKATSNAALPALVRPLVGADTAVLIVQNGLGGAEVLEEAVGARHVLTGLSFICSNRVGPGKIDHIGFGLIRFGTACTGSVRAPQDVARELTALGLEVIASPDIARERWAKLMWNVPFNGLGAAMDVSVDRLLVEPGLALVTRLMHEVMDTAGALGIRFDHREQIIAAQIEKTARMGPYRTSMQLDRREGRPLEREAILSRPLAVAKQHGVATPVMEVVDAMVGAIAR
jgi:2-dehydropantoate 2-reductase